MRTHAVCVLFESVQLMYTEDQIRTAACGKADSQGGLNLADIKKILTASGLSTSGNGDAVVRR